MSGALRRVGAPGCVAALICLAGLSLARVYHGSLITQLVAGAAVGSVFVSVLLHRAPAWLVAPVSVVAMATYALFAVDLSARSGGIAGHPRALAVDAAYHALPRLLTALIPVEPQPDTVLGPVVLAWLAGFAGAELSARARRVAVSLVPPTLLYAGTLVLVGPNAPMIAWHPLAFAAIAALGLGAGSSVPMPRSLPGLARKARTLLRLRTSSGLLAGLAATLAAVALAAPLVARTVGRDPVDPRGYVAPPSLDVLDQNPLIRISGWATNPDQRLLRVEVLRGAPPERDPAPASPDSGNTDPASTDPASTDPASTDPASTDPAQPGDAGPIGAHDTRLRLAVLADWDGVTWHVDAAYRNAGRVLPPVSPPPGQTPASGAGPALVIEERITVEELAGRLLPAVSAPRRVDGVRVAYDLATGALLHATPISAGLAYTVTSMNPSVEVNLLPASDVPAGAAAARYLAVGDVVPPDLGRLADQIATGESSPYLRALALESFLAEHYRLAADAPSGHAYPNLRFFLFGEPRAGGQRGTSEQFAAAFGALGRLMGLPTRVVVGFHTPSGGGVVTGADAFAWPEVLFDGVGWVAFNPLPDPDTPPRPLEDEFLPKPEPPTSAPVSVEPSAVPTHSASVPSAPPPAGGVRRLDAGLVAGGVGGGLVTLLLLAVLVLSLLRWLRRRHQVGRGGPWRRVLGAWDEVLDALTLAGRAPPTHLAATEVAAHAAALIESAPGRHARRPRPSAPALHDLAAKVNAVGFTAGQPELGGEPDELAALTARIQALAYARALRERRSWWRRLWWRIDPRPLRRAR